MQHLVTRRSIVLTLLCGLALTPGAESGEPESASRDTRSDVLATWNDGLLTGDEFASWQKFRGNPADGTLSEASLADAIRELVFVKSLAETATADGLGESREVRLQLEALRRSVLVPILRREVIAGFSVSNEEIEAAYREHPEAFSKPRKLKLRNIYKGFDTVGDEAVVRERMQQIFAELAAGADFGALAIKESVSQSAPRGGSLGWVDPAELPPPVAEVVRTLAPGGISRPVEHGSGISIFLCEDVREARTPTPDEVRAKLRTQLERQRGRAGWEAFQEGLLELASPRIDPGSSTVVLAFPGYRLDAEDLKALLALQATRTGVAQGVEQTKELLRSWALGVLDVRRAVELGLDSRPETAEALRWGRVEILARAELARRLLAALPEPTDDDLRQFFDEHQRYYRQPATYDLGLIDFGNPDGTNARTAVERAVTVGREISSGVLSFEEAARRYSKHPSAGAGGDIGWKTRQQIALWGPTASTAIFRLRTGETTPILHLDSGLKIFTLRGERESRALSFAEVEDRVRGAWLNQKLPELEANERLEYLDHIDLTIRPTGAPPPRVIRWSTATEFENYGYHVYRGSSPDGPFERLTAEPIPGAGTTDLPHSYEYVDTTATPGTLYYYYVEAISTSGSTRRLTPVRASTGEEP